MGLFDGTPLQRPVTCATCGEALTHCPCPRDATGAPCPPSAQPARVHREKRRGKWTTVVTGLDPHATDLKALLKHLKTRHAAGGTTTADGLELQGDHRDAIIAHLQTLGHPTKPTGG